MNKPFRNRFAGPKLSPEEASRQGHISRLAFERLRQPAAVIAFLNTHDDKLGGRPLDLAIASSEGMANVEAALAELAQANS